MSYTGNSRKMREFKNNIIMVLEESEEPLSYRQIANELDVKSSEVHEILLDLVEVGRVRKRQDWLFESIE